jgi:hypothetical protein
MHRGSRVLQEATVNLAYSVDVDTTGGIIERVAHRIDVCEHVDRGCVAPGLLLKVSYQSFNEARPVLGEIGAHA